MHRNLIIGLLFVAILSGSAIAAPVNGKQFEFTQPDGTKVPVKVWGDEFYQRVESLDGYALVRDADGWISYADLSADESEFVATDARYGGKTLAEHPKGKKVKARKNFKKKLKINSKSRRDKVEANRKKLGYDKLIAPSYATSDAEAAAAAAAASPDQPITYNPMTGGVVGLTICVNFPDELGTITSNDVDDFCNQPGYAGYDNNGSVYDYFYDVSGDNLSYTNIVVGYFTASKDKSYYDDPTREAGEAGRELFGEALAWLEAEGFDFNQLSTNSDNEFIAVNVFYAGSVSSGWTMGLWPHSGYYGLYTAPTGQTVGRYQITDMGSSLEIGTFCHENGHMVCQWPDLYDYDGNSQGVGMYCLMASGNFDGTNPIPPNAYFRDIKGWEDVTDISDFNQSFTLISNSNNSYRYLNSANSAEAFYIESRTNSGRNTSLPDAGMMIWHVDEDISEQKDGYRVNDDEQMTSSLHYMVSLEQADGRFDLETDLNDGGNYGDSADLFDLGGKSEFNDNTVPDAKWWDGTGSGLIIENIGAIGSEMTFGPDVNPPSPDPMEWENVPVAVGVSTIYMEAVLATDPSGFEYSFECTLTNDPAFIADPTQLDSGWQSSPVYVMDQGSAGMTYEFSVMARDFAESVNETAWSTPISVTTADPADNLPPAPNDPTPQWGTLPYTVRIDPTPMVRMSAKKMYDESGPVEYYFECTDVNGGGPDSTFDSTSWSTSEYHVITDPSFDENSTYKFKFRARDAFAPNNYTLYSEEATLGSNANTPGVHRVPDGYPTIQAAIDAASDGDIVIVSEDTYSGPGNRDLDFMGKAITLRSEYPDNPENVEATIIDCGGSATGFESDSHRAFDFHSGETASSVVNGFTIINGYIRIDGEDVWGPGTAGNYGTNSFGGAVICTSSSSPTIMNCVIKNCVAEGGSGSDGTDGDATVDPPVTVGGDGGAGGMAAGGAIYCDDTSRPFITGVTIDGCRAIGGNGGNGARGANSDATLPTAAGPGGKGGDGGAFIENNHGTITPQPYGGACGGAIYVDESNPGVEIANCIIKNCTVAAGTAGNGGDGGDDTVDEMLGGAAGAGGNSYDAVGGAVVCGKGAAVTITNSSITKNKTVVADGGTAGNAGVPFGEFASDGNSSRGLGGGVWYGSDCGTVTIQGIDEQRTTISDNTSANDGGGIYFGSDKVGGSTNPVLTDCDITGNTITSGDGGGIWFGENGTMIIDNCQVNQNMAGDDDSGGGIRVGVTDSGSTIIVNTFLTIQNGTDISDNKADSGGGIYAANTDLDILSASRLTGNTASAGGGLWIGGSLSKLKLEETMVVGNSASKSSAGYGGGIASNDIKRLNLANSVISDNESGGYGGGLYTDGFNANLYLITSCLFTNNKTAYEGGAISCNVGSWAEVRNCTIADNAVESALGIGGGVHCSEGYAWVKLVDSIVWGNTASQGSQLAAGRFNGSMTGSGNATIDVEYCDVQGLEADIFEEPYVPVEIWFMGNNIGDDIEEHDPLFATGAMGNMYIPTDYFLSQADSYEQVTSPAVDAGSTLSSANGMDIVTTKTNSENDEGIVDLGYHYSNYNPGTYELIIRWSNDPDPDIINYQGGTVGPEIVNPDSRYLPGTVVTLIANPHLVVDSDEVYHRVKEWDGSDNDPSRTETEVTVTVDYDGKTVTAYFEPDIHSPITVPGNFTDIQDAVDSAVDGDTIVLDTKQTHFLRDMPNVGPEGIDFKGKDILFTSKGFNPDNPEPEVIAAAIIDCGGTEYISRRAFNLHSGEGNNAIIQGFTIRNAYFSGDGKSGSTGIGIKGYYPGITVTTEEVTPDDDDYWFDYADSGQHASGDGYGGAILCGAYTGGSPAVIDDSENAYASPTIRHCVFENNTITGARGGDGDDGVNAPWENSDWRSSDPTAEPPEPFEEAQWGGHGGHGDGQGFGGAIACLNGSSPIIENCTFKNSIARGGMGGNGGTGGDAIDANDDPTGTKGQGGEPGDAGAIPIIGDPGYGWPGMAGIGADAFGGAVYTDGAANNDNQASSPKFVNCIFETNDATEGNPGVTGADGEGDDLDEDDDYHGRQGVTYIQQTIAGGAICTDDGVTLDIEASQFIDNKAYFTYQIFGLFSSELEIYLTGGAISCQQNATIDIADTIFEGNLGGAINCSSDPNVVITDSVFINNEAPYDNGGAICLGKRAKKIEISGSSFSGNTSGLSGGALFYRDVVEGDMKAKITGCSFAGNSADGTGLDDGFGGAICSYDLDKSGTLVSTEFRDCNFQSNNAYKGGAVYMWQFQDTYFSDCYVMNNQAYDGGGLYFVDGDFIFDNGTVGLNKATNPWSIGGGIYAQQVEAEIYSTTFNENKVTGTNGYGGAIGFYLADEEMWDVNEPLHKIVNCIFADNTSTSRGGAISCEAIAPLIENCTFANNESDGGGAVYLDFNFAIQRNAAITDSIFAGNTGQAVYEESADDDPSISHCLFYENPDGDYAHYTSDNNELVIVTGADDLNATNKVDNALDDDPVFVEGSRGDYYLDPNTPSPAINAGSLATDKLAHSTEYDDIKEMRDLTVTPSGEADDDEMDLGFHRDPKSNIEYTLTVEVVAGSGTVAIKDAKDKLITDTSHTYHEGEQVTLIADPAGNYRVDKWTGGTLFDNTPAITNYVIMTGDMNIEIEFESVNVLRVALEGGGTDPDYTEKLYSTIPEAVDAAQDYDIIIVDPGIWKAPNGRLSGGIYVNKKITIMSTDPTNPDVVAATIVDGTRGTTTEWTSAGFYFGSMTDKDTVLYGLTVRNCGGFAGVGLDGDRDQWGPNGIDGGTQRGSGLFIAQGGEPVIRNCIITDNVMWGGHGGNGVNAEDDPVLNAGRGGWPGGAHGAGVYCAPSSAPSFINCQITDNTVAGGEGGDGGDDVLPGGFANYGGGLSSPDHIYIDPYSSDISFIEDPLWEHMGFDYDAIYYSGMGGGVFCADASNVTFEGCTITGNAAYGGIVGEGGYLDPVGQLEPVDEYKLPAWGGGVYCGDLSTVKFTDCEISDNLADRIGFRIERDAHTVTDEVMNRINPYVSYGGGVAAENQATITFDNCTIGANEAAVGGGVYWADGSTATINESTIIANAAYSGAGLHAANSLTEVSEITDCLIIQNDGTVTPEPYLAPNESIVDVSDEANIGTGAGLSATSMRITVKDTEFDQNAASGAGGAIYFGTSQQDQYQDLDELATFTMRLENCLVTDNTAALEGGGLAVKLFSQPLISNCTFANNDVPNPIGTTGGYGGGGIYVGLESVATIINSILWENDAPAGSQIAYGNDDPYDPMPSTVNISYCDIQYGQDKIFAWKDNSTSTNEESILNWGSGNIDVDPDFQIHEVFGNYFLSQDTALINAGSMSAVNAGLDTYTTDVDGDVDEDGVDLGYHYNGFTGEGTTQYQLTVDVVGDNGTFQIEDLPKGRNTGWFPDGELVKITAIPDPGFRVSSWGGHVIDASSADIVNQALMSAPDRKVEITFGPSVNIYVPSSEASSIPEAIAIARDGDTIIVAEGQYYSHHNAGIVINKDITITSTYPDVPEVVANTIIACPGEEPEFPGLGVGVTFGSDANEGAQLIGFTIRNCYTRPVDSIDAADAGQDGEDGEDRFAAGINCAYGSSPTIRNCVIEDNSSYGGNAGAGAAGGDMNEGGNGGWAGGAYGGGVYVGVEASPTFVGCIIRNNQALGGDAGDGGAYGTSGTSNTAPGYGGSYSNPLVSDATYIAMGYQMDFRYYSGYGGGIFCAKDSNARFVNCQITNNLVRGGMSGIGGDREFGIRQVPVYAYEIPSYGGGVYIAEGATADFIDCLIAENESPKFTLVDEVPRYHVDPYLGHGGGIAAEKTTEVNFDNCIFTANEASLGGGLYWMGENDDDTLSQTSIVDCNFADNLAYMGAGLFADTGVMTMDNTKLLDNFAGVSGEDTANISGVGGAVYWNTMAGTIKNSQIYSNNATLSGAGIYVTGQMYSEMSKSLTNPIFFNNVIYSNSATRDGGGISANWYAAPSIQNCTIIDNEALNTDDDDSYGGGIFAGYDADVYVTDSIVYQNSATQGSQMSVGSAYDPYATSPGAKLSVYYSNLGGGQSSYAVHVSSESTLDYDDATNINTDPLFVTGNLGDYYLSNKPTQSSTSPAVDAGSDSAAAIGLSTRTTRTNGAYDAGIVNLGYHYPLSLTAVQNTCRFCDMPDTEYSYASYTDVEGAPFENGDRLRPNGTIDFSDWAVIASHWLGTCEDTDVPDGEMAWCDGADVNKDLLVDLVDVKQMAVCWLEEDTTYPVIEGWIPPVTNDSELIKTAMEEDAWAIVPNSANGSNSIQMAANPFIDAWFTPDNDDDIIGDEVMYAFICYNSDSSVNETATSNWKSLSNEPDPTMIKYTTPELTADTSYTFKIVVSDLISNHFYSNEKTAIAGEDSSGPTSVNWDRAPSCISDAEPYEMIMSGLTASDNTGPIRYMFRCTSHGYNSSINTDEGGDGWLTAAEWDLESGGQGIFWQDDSVKVLDETYTYQFGAMDDSQSKNITWSNEMSAIAGTLDDTTPPDPDPMEWASVPVKSVVPVINQPRVTMAVVAASDDMFEVEYYFDCVNMSELSSPDWQESPSYSVDLLSYTDSPTFRVIARDTSPNQNMTGWSTSLEAIAP